MSNNKLYKLTDSNGKEYYSENKGTLGGHKKLKIYGRLDCPSALRHIAKGNYVKYRVFFADEAAAIAAGYRPCAICMREKYLQWKQTQQFSKDNFLQNSQHWFEYLQSKYDTKNVY